MSMEKMREQFEAWALTHFINSDSMHPLVRDEEEPGEYRYSRVNMAWVAWQASREALAVDIPELRLCCEDFGVEFVKNIEAAGVKVSQ